MKSAVIFAWLLATMALVLAQEQNKNQEEKQQFIYVLKLIPELLDEKNWSERETKIVEAHFARLQEHLKAGKLVLAGRTQNQDEKMFGIVILEVDSEQEARSIMVNDPAVKNKIMTAELFPYKIRAAAAITGEMA